MPVQWSPQLELCPRLVKVGVQEPLQLGGGVGQRQVGKRRLNDVYRETQESTQVGGSSGGKLTNLRGGCRRLMSTKYLSSSKSLAVWTRWRMGPMQ